LDHRGAGFCAFFSRNCDRISGDAFDFDQTFRLQSTFSLIISEIKFYPITIMLEIMSSSPEYANCLRCAIYLQGSVATTPIDIFTSVSITHYLFV
uniref:Ovule protein n=1 Tax=Ascaris lumbricoides TaxID=6252 RepID=A0A0M3I2Z1_ASCLU